MAITNLITAANVVTYAVKKTTYDTTRITQNIPLVQEVYLRPFLGDDFYEEIVAAYGGYSSEQTDLMDNYIVPGLSYFVLYESFWENQVKETNAGNVLTTTEFSQNPSEKQLELKRSDYLDKGNKWFNMAQKFIEDSQETTPTLFANYSATLSDNAQESTSNIFIPE